MKMLIIISIILFVSLLSCNKNKFTPCENYDKLVGKWIAIDGDEKDILIIDAKGNYKSISALNRGVKAKIISCENKSFTGLIYGQEWECIALELNEGSASFIVAIYHSANFDSIAKNTQPFDSDTSFTKRKRFIRY